MDVLGIGFTAERRNVFQTSNVIGIFSYPRCSFSLNKAVVFLFWIVKHLTYRCLIKLTGGHWQSYQQQTGIYIHYWMPQITMTTKNPSVNNVCFNFVSVELSWNYLCYLCESVISWGSSVRVKNPLQKYF